MHTENKRRFLTTTESSDVHRFDSELLQVLVVGHVLGNGALNHVRGLLAIRLLPFGVQLLIRLWNLFLFRY